MARAVVCTRTPGQTDTIEDDVTGVYVPIGDVDALRGAIRSLLDDPERVTRLGESARTWAVANADVTRYAEVLAGTVAEVASDTP